jgi:hypothetical protein
VLVAFILSWWNCGLLVRGGVATLFGVFLKVWTFGLELCAAPMRQYIDRKIKIDDLKIKFESSIYKQLKSYYKT